MQGADPGEETTVLSCATDVPRDFDPIQPLDPLSKDAPPLPCRVEDSDLWFSERPADLEAAKAFCLGCPARAACLAGAVQRRELWGVWGGEIFDRGVIIARKRPRGRPRKDRTAVAA